MIKYSRQREAIKEFLACRKDHPTADVIYDNIRIQYPNISLGTVYRNLSLLTELGEIRKLSGFGDADRFDGRTDPHAHFVCRICNQVMDVNSTSWKEKLAMEAENAVPGRVENVVTMIYGVCNKCCGS